MMGDEGHLFFGGGFMWILWILLIVGVFLIIFNLTQGSSPSQSQDKESPIDILKKRYARGEIEEEEFERRRKELGN